MTQSPNWSAIAVIISAIVATGTALARFMQHQLARQERARKKTVKKLEKKRRIEITAIVVQVLKEHMRAEEEAVGGAVKKLDTLLDLFEGHVKADDDNFARVFGLLVPTSLPTSQTS